MIEDQQKDRSVGTVTGQGEIEDWGKIDDSVLDNLNEWADIIQTHVNS